MNFRYLLLDCRARQSISDTYCVAIFQRYDTYYSVSNANNEFPTLISVFQRLINKYPTVITRL